MKAKSWKKKIMTVPRDKVMKILAAVGLVGVGTALFVKRDKVKGAVQKIKNKVKRVG
jgi:hypothetical protein